MTTTRTDTVSTLLAAPRQAERDLLDDLLPVVYDELREIAHRHLNREYGPRTLDTTALVHEAYLKLVDEAQVPVKSRAYFFGAAARAMHQVLVDQARKRLRLKRGAGERPLPLEDITLQVDSFAAHLLDLDEALGRLTALYPRQAHVVQCRFFAGLSVEETSAALELSKRTVKRDWAMARAWLFRELGQSEVIEVTG